MKAYYEARAREYDEWWLGQGLYAQHAPEGWDEERALLERWIGELTPAKTLDVACGTGFMTRHLRGEIVALDQSESMLEVAREQAAAADYVQGEALDLPFEDRSFDRVFASFFYCHLEREDAQRFREEARRVARELVIVGTPTQDGQPNEAWVERRLNDGSRWQVFKRLFDSEELAEELGGRVLHQSRFFVMVAAP